MVAQGSRRCIFSIDAIDESRNRSKGAQVHGDLQADDERLAQKVTSLCIQYRHRRRVEESITGF